MVPPCCLLCRTKKAGHASAKPSAVQSETTAQPGRRLVHLRELSGDGPTATHPHGFTQSKPISSFDNGVQDVDPEAFTSTRSMSVATADFEQHRPMLLAGSLITQYEKGTPQSRHLMLSSDMRALVIKRKKRVTVGPCCCCCCRRSAQGGGNAPSPVLCPFLRLPGHPR